MAMPHTDRRRFTVDEYHRMGEAGILTEDDRVELLEGEIVAMSPIGRRHAGAVNRLNRRFNSSAPAVTVSVQNPVVLDPQPDIAVLRYRADGYAAYLPTPSDVLLLIEVADSSTSAERHRKLALYATAGVPEVWFADLGAEVVEVWQNPTDTGFANRREVRRGTTLTPVLVPQVSVSVDEVLG